MQDELNYLSEKIEEIEMHEDSLEVFGIEYDRKEEKMIEKQLLNNILSYITLKEME